MEIIRAQALTMNNNLKLMQSKFNIKTNQRNFFSWKIDGNYERTDVKIKDLLYTNTHIRGFGKCAPL